MKPLRLAALVLAAALSLGASKPHPNWLTTVAVTPEGTHVLGNPQAQAKLVEYVSYTCSHCAHFQTAADVPLRLAYVQPGKVSVEVRHLVRDPVDLAAALLANCGDRSRFFRNHHELLASQARWINRVQDSSASQQARWTNGPLRMRMRAIAADFGFYDIMSRRGYQRAELDRCLADEAMADRIVAQRDRAIEAGVDSTPTFFLNNEKLDAHDWPTLNAQLVAQKWEAVER